MLPARHHACAETTGADLSSRMMSVSALSSVTIRTSGGMAGMELFVIDEAESAAVRFTVIVSKISNSANAHFMATGSYTREARGEGGRKCRNRRMDRVFDTLLVGEGWFSSLAGWSPVVGYWVSLRGQ